MDVDVRGVIVGFVAAAVVLGALVWFVGVDHIVDTLRMLDQRLLPVLVGLTLLWLATWGLALRSVLHALGVEIGRLRAVFLYASAVFSNNVTPFGQAGGEPFSALLIARTTNTEYERGLAAIASVDTLNFFPSIVLATVGMGYYLTAFAVGDDFTAIIVALVALGVGVPAIGIALWRRRDGVQSIVTSVLARLLAVVGRTVPRVTAPERDRIRQRVAAFFVAIERVADSKRDLVVALALSSLGWLCLTGSLWVSLGSVGYWVPFAAVMVVVPLATVASLTPLPGGLGGVEAAVVLLVVPITGVSTATASAAVLVDRVATYWLPTVLGAGAAAALESDRSG